MNKFSDIIKTGKGLYKIAFCICIVLLCIVTIVITDYDEKQSVAKNIESTLQEDSHNMFGIEADNSASDTETLYEEKTDINVTNPIVKDMSFAPPLEGAVIKVYSDNTPIYSQTMDDWRIHTGIDIGVDIGSDVFAAQAGIVDYIGYDVNLGYKIHIVNGDFECRYMSLSSDIPVNVGDEVVKGQYIGTVSDTAMSEFCDGGHLHFEIKKDGSFVNPSEYIYY